MREGRRDMTWTDVQRVRLSGEPSAHCVAPPSTHSYADVCMSNYVCRCRLKTNMLKQLVTSAPGCRGG